jgi:hypothetical protein
MSALTPIVLFRAVPRILGAPSTACSDQPRCLLRRHNTQTVLRISDGRDAFLFQEEPTIDEL